MKAIILGATTAIVAVAGLAAPAGATVNGGGYLAGNSGFSTSSSGRIGVKDGKFYIEGETVMCSKMNFAMGGNMQFGNGPTANVPNGNLPSADTSNCNATEVVNNPPANSTVTISGVCDDIAAKLKANVTGTNVTVIVNSTGACKDDNGTPVPTTPAGPIVVNVNVKNPEPTVKQASTSTPAPAASSNAKGSGTTAELPQTGASEVITAVVATILAGGAYAGTMAIRAFRARA